MIRTALVTASLLMLPLPALPASSAAAASFQDEAGGDAQKCAPEKKKKRKALGGFLGSMAGSVIGATGVSSGLGGLWLPAGELLSEAILSMLDCKEQQQAANATNEAVRGGVGSEVEWKSETRANVSGKSRVTGEEQASNGSHCMTVTDVVIVDGEETTASKRMCRAPGASGYARV
ncbi:MAG TPA: hypothetical protein VGB62_10120 [Allosphingosinicella sp.]|jgi:hypothetical protein